MTGVGKQPDKPLFDITLNRLMLRLTFFLAGFLAVLDFYLAESTPVQVVSVLCVIVTLGVALLWPDSAPRDFLFNNWLLIICIYLYYRLCVNFLGQALLLLQDGANGVPQFYDWIFALTDPAIDALSFWLPILFSLVVFGGIYYLKSGSFNPKVSDRNAQYLSVVALTPFVLYFVFF